jgi:L-histidine N-alpha-methyltransferase
MRWTQPAAYLPVDISGDYLMSVARELTRRYPGIEILPICADFTQPLDLPRAAARSTA